ncbi:putative Ig domain-containing protein [Leptospira sp. 201903070]|uniref:Ig domain-containing protein n=1 Tax=Leptospira ainlahdjerensis TaxID=2810033 RepID=A0ABS2UEW4_9LEPT|nr:putative Ig domain-containing protein [Leptospira ainlahdjerensis]MBM9577663.1 putative Ig domain-containing protein [Leptospira ainlahdjerensis]MBM9577757.1 putative Ig domain-containing protein [Leptospira ainlahdjerensis]
MQDHSSGPFMVLLGYPTSLTNEDLFRSNENAPTLTYPASSFQFVKNIAISTIRPTITGASTSISISPALPSGLTLDSTTGEITGMPTSKQVVSSYTITALNSFGSSSVSIQISIDALNAEWESFLKSPNPDIGDTSGGFDLDLSGDTLVVGMCGEDGAQTGIVSSPFAGLTSVADDDSASAAGAAYVFRRTGTTWILEAYLKAPNTEANDQYGCSVAVSGDTIVVGARAEDGGNSTIVHSPFAGLTPAGDDDSLISAGAAYVYRRTGSTWALEAYLKAPNADPGDQFGVSVSISGDRIAVGAVQERGGLGVITQAPAPGFTGATDNDSAPTSGAVYIFERTGTTWAWDAYLKAPNVETGDLFGVKIQVRGDTLLVGASNEDSGNTAIQNSPGPSLTPAGDDDSLSGSGAVYVFRKTGPNWAFESYLKAPNADNSDQFGVSLDLSEDGSVAVIGAYNEDSAQTTISNSLGPNLTTLGDDDSATSSGAVYVFRRNGNIWAFEAYLKSPNIEASDNFGRSVSISGDTILVGATGEDSFQTGVLHSPATLPGPGVDDDSVSNSGAAYVFRKTSSGWTFQSYLKAPNAESSDAFGMLVCIDGDLMAVAAQNDDDGLGLILNKSNGPPPTPATDDDSVSNSGAAHIFYK